MNAQFSNCYWIANCRFQKISNCSDRAIAWHSYWCVNSSAMIAYIYFMYLSMLTPGWGGAGRPRGIWHFHESQSQISHPRAPRKCQIPTSRYCFLPKTSRSYLKFPTPGQKPNVKIPTQGKARRVNFPWIARPPPPPPWGLSLIGALNVHARERRI